MRRGRATAGASLSSAPGDPHRPASVPSLSRTPERRSGRASRALRSGSSRRGAVSPLSWGPDSRGWAAPPGNPSRADPYRDRTSLSPAVIPRLDFAAGRGSGGFPDEEDALPKPLLRRCGGAHRPSERGRHRPGGESVAPPPTEDSADGLRRLRRLGGGAGDRVPSRPWGNGPSGVSLQRDPVAGRGRCESLWGQ